MAFNIVTECDDFVEIKNILVSVFDKTGLDAFIPSLIKINPNIKIVSTGGTYKAIEKIIGKNAEKYLIKASDYTKQPEMQGGLVKTLDFKIYLGLLSETYNEEHQRDIKRTNSLIIDMVVCNLYPFERVIFKKDITPELARTNIDIGGPSMIRASAKNYIRALSVTDPLDYKVIISELIKNSGKVSLKLRFQSAVKAFKHTAYYDKIIAEFLSSKKYAEFEQCYLIK
jgi:phosphoribosylaminoimidazolecarboxamide formyltransferase/IMP cyclohydrolase